VPYFFALLVAALAVLGWVNFVPVIQSSDLLALWVSLLFIAATATYLAGTMKRGYWASHFYFAIIVSNLVLQIEATLVLVIASSFVALLIGRVFDNSTGVRELSGREFAYELASRITVGGFAALTSYGIYRIGGGIFPFSTFENVPNLLLALVASLTGYAVIIMLGKWIANHRNSLPNFMRTLIVTDLVLQVAALVLAVIFTSVGTVTTIISVVLLTFQSYRYHQINRTRDLLNRRARDVSVLNTLGQAVSGNLSLGEVLAQVHEQIATLVSATAVFSSLYDDTSNVLEFPAVQSKIGEQKPRKRTLSNGLSDWVVRNRRTLRLTRQDTPNLRDMGIDPTLMQVEAIVAVPLMVGDKIIGVLGVAHNSNADAFDEMDVTVLQTVASQAALAIRNASLYNRSIRLANNLSVINQSLQQVMFNLDRNALVRAACYIACQVTEAEKAAVFTVQDRLGLKVVAEKGLEGLLPDEYYIPYRPDLYRDGSRMIMNVDESKDAETLEMAKHLGFKACLEVPLRSSNTLVGMIVIYHDEPHIYEFTDISLMEMLANQVTAAFDNTDLLQALELYASEQAQLVYLSRISTSNLDLERVIVDVSNMLAQMVNMDRVDVGIFRAQEDMDVYRVNEDQVQLFVLPLSTIAEISIVTENPQLANPYILYADDESISPDTCEYMQRNNMQFLALMPMTVSKQVFGVLMLSSSEPLQILDNTRRLLEMAIHQVSAQIHNARIYTITEEALSQQLEQLSLIEDIAQKISQSLNLNVIIANVLDAAIRATQADFAEILLQNPNRPWEVYRQLPDGTSEQHERTTNELSADVLEAMNNNDLVASAISTMTKQGSYVSVPLLSGERPLGVLRVVGADEDMFDQEHANFIRSLAGHASISIENAYLLEERQFQVNALTSLRALSLEVLGNVDDTEVTDAILRATLDLLEANEVALYGYDHRTDELVPMAALRRKGQVYELVEPRINAQPIYKGIRSHKVTVEQAGEQAEYDSQGNLTYPTLVVIPITRHAQIKEVLVVGYETSRELERQDYNAIDLLTVQVAGHLENIILNQAIRTSNNRMRVILDSTRDGIILLDNVGRIQEANRRANDLLQAELSNAIGEPFGRFIQQNLSDNKLASDLLTSQDFTSDYREISMTDGDQTTYLQTMVLPVRDAEGGTIGRLLSIRDITEEKQLSLTRDSLQRMVIHDLRSPMGAIITGLSFIQVLIDDVDPAIARDINRTLEASLESADNLLRLMDTLRDIQRMKDIVIDTHPISLRTLATKAYESLQPLFAEANIEFEMLMERDEQVRVDIDLIRRVIINLLHNALKFTPENGKIVITADYKSHEGFVRVTVCDNGPGIPLAMRERIFAEFQQVEGQMPKRGGRGTGLGLTLCKLAIEAHGGVIWVDNEGVLSGACFAFTLPIDHAHTEAN
jgi:PAS domain S-box-containing protein